MYIWCVVVQLQVLQVRHCSHAKQRDIRTWNGFGSWNLDGAHYEKHPSIIIRFYFDCRRCTDRDTGAIPVFWPLSECSPKASYHLTNFMGLHSPQLCGYNDVRIASIRCLVAEAQVQQVRACSRAKRRVKQPAPTSVQMAIRANRADGVQMHVFCVRFGHLRVPIMDIPMRILMRYIVPRVNVAYTSERYL